MLRALITVDAVGGVWRYALDLVRGLEPFGVTCLLVGFGPEPVEVQVAECRALPNAHLTWIEEPLDWMVADSAMLSVGTERLATLARAWGADLLHLNAPSQAAGLDGALPTVVVAHSCVPTWWRAVRGSGLPPEWAWHLDLNRSGLRRADVVVTPSESHARALGEAYGALPSHRGVPNAVAPRPAPGAKQRLILGAGRWWDEGKNGQVLDAAAPASPWPVILAGPLSGPNGASAAFANCETTGPLPHADVQALMERAAIFAAPSVYEPFGLAVAEAAAAGAALVLSDIPTFRELWQDAALFVPAHEPAAWAEAFRLLASDEALRQRLATAARARASRFAPRRQAERMYAIYRQLHAMALA